MFVLLKITASEIWACKEGKISRKFLSLKLTLFPLLPFAGLSRTTNRFNKELQ